MKAYPLHLDQCQLHRLPSLLDAEGYEVIEGNPRTSIRTDSGSTDTKNRLGVWMCTPGTFTCTEKGNELQTILEGKLMIILGDGTSHQFGPGDSFYTQKGERLTWNIVETVKKVFFTYYPDSAV